MKEAQDKNFAEKGKYLQVFPYEENGVKKWTDEYIGPLGAGYIEREEKIENGVKYQRAKDYGPEGRSHDWQIVHGING